MNDEFRESLQTNDKSDKNAALGDDNNGAYLGQDSEITYCSCLRKTIDYALQHRDHTFNYSLQKRTTSACCVHARTALYTCVHMWTHTYICIHINVRSCVRTHRCGLRHTAVYSHVPLCTRTYNYVRTHTALYTHVPMCIFTYRSVSPRTAVHAPILSCQH